MFVEEVGDFCAENVGIKIACDNDVVPCLDPFCESLVEVFEERSAGGAFIVFGSEISFVLRGDSIHVPVVHRVWSVETDYTKDSTIFATVSCPRPSSQFGGVFSSAHCKVGELSVGHNPGAAPLAGVAGEILFVVAHIRLGLVDVKVLFNPFAPAVASGCHAPVDAEFLYSCRVEAILANSTEEFFVFCVALGGVEISDIDVARS